jgi:hypothetical protein
VRANTYCNNCDDQTHYNSHDDCYTDNSKGIPNAPGASINSRKGMGRREAEERKGLLELRVIVGFHLEVDQRSRGARARGDATEVDEHEKRGHEKDDEDR